MDAHHVLISLFATLGITFSVMVLPLAGLPYKLISLVLIVIGIVWARTDLKRNSCEVNWRT